MAQESARSGFFRSKKWERFRGKYLTASCFLGFCWKVVRFVLLFGLCYIILYPFFIKTVNAFKGVADLTDVTVRFIPKNFTLDNILSVVDNMKYFPTLVNTLLLAGVSSVLQTAVSTVAGYGFAKFRFILNKPLFLLVIFSLIVPPQTIIIPLFLQFRFFAGLDTAWMLNTPLPMFILSLTGLGIKNALYIFLFRQFFRNTPRELEEAAYIDGCGVFRTFLKIMLPSATSLLVTVLLLAFSWQWTDTTYSSLFLREFDVMATMVSMAGQTASDSLVASCYVGIGSLLSILPVALIYVFAQRFFVQSISTSGLVG